MYELVLRTWMTLDDALLDVDIRDLHYDISTGTLFAGTGGNGGLVSYSISEGQALAEVDRQYYSASQAFNLTGRIDATQIGTQNYLLVSDPGAAGYVAYQVGSNGQIGNAIGITADPPDADCCRPHIRQPKHALWHCAVPCDNQRGRPGLCCCGICRRWRMRSQRT